MADIVLFKGAVEGQRARPDDFNSNMTILEAAVNTAQTDIDTLEAGRVQTTGNETIAGVKTFSSSPIVPTPTTDYQSSTKKYVDDNAVAVTGDETVAGVKTFSSSPIVPTPTTDYQASTKKYVDDNAVAVTGDETIAGIKTFASSPIVAHPAADDDTYKAATTKFVREVVVALSPLTSITGMTDTDIVGSTEGQILEFKIATSKWTNTTPTPAVAKTADTGAAVMPVGTTAQRPGSPAAGYMRYNTDLGMAEVYNGSLWSAVAGGQMLGSAQVKAISYNAQTISENITIAADQNASAVGTITVADGYTVTVEDGGRLVIL